MSDKHEDEIERRIADQKFKTQVIIQLKNIDDNIVELKSDVKSHLNIIDKNNIHTKLGNDIGELAISHKLLKQRLAIYGSIAIAFWVLVSGIFNKVIAKYFGG